MAGDEIQITQYVVIQDIRMTLWSMIVFMTKFAISTLFFTIFLAVVWGVFALIVMRLVIPQ